MAGAVVGLLEDRAAAAEMGGAGRERVRSEFDSRASARNVLELYHECLGRRRG
jgi:hypothetical protein